jgi:hypothetical protein
MLSLVLEQSGVVEGKSLTCQRIVKISSTLPGLDIFLIAQKGETLDKYR